jgi:hypothetical protein
MLLEAVRRALHEEKQDGAGRGILAKFASHQDGDRACLLQRQIGRALFRLWSVHIAGRSIRAAGRHDVVIERNHLYSQYEVVHGLASATSSPTSLAGAVL